MVRGGLRMNRKSLILFIFFLMICINSYVWAGESASLSATGPDKLVDYTIGPGDVLDISVWKNSEMTKTVTVRPDGMISFPLIGEVTAKEKTVAELKKEMETKISRFIPKPVLSVLVQTINSMHIFVIGKVNKPGRFELNTNINVLQALSMAGGLNPFAKKNKIKIQRDLKGSTQIYDFYYDDVTKRGKIEQNIKLQRGDVIIVP